MGFGVNGDSGNDINIDKFGLHFTAMFLLPKCGLERGVGTYVAR
jgi:hypothetical protein